MAPFLFSTRSIKTASHDELPCPINYHTIWYHTISYHHTLIPAYIPACLPAMMKSMTHLFRWSARRAAVTRNNNFCPHVRCFAALSSSFHNNNNNNNNNNDRVLTSLDDTTGICTVTLNRPDKLNALDWPMFVAIYETIQALHRQHAARPSSLRAVVVQGAGRAFCAGLDVTSLQSWDAPRIMRQLLERPPPVVVVPPTANHERNAADSVTNLAQAVAYGWRTLPVPVVAALHGACFGGGLQIALGADLRIATPDAQLSVMEARWGLIPDMSISVTLRELVRADVAKELTWSGRQVPGTEAAALGLVTRIVDDNTAAAVQQAAHAQCRAFVAHGSPDALAAAKTLYQTTWTRTSDAACLRLESELQQNILLTWNQLAAAARTVTGYKVPYGSKRANANATEVLNDDNEDDGENGNESKSGGSGDASAGTTTKPPNK